MILNNIHEMNVFMNRIHEMDAFMNLGEPNSWNWYFHECWWTVFMKWLFMSLHDHVHEMDISWIFTSWVHEMDAFMNLWIHECWWMCSWNQSFHESLWILKLIFMKLIFNEFLWAEFMKWCFNDSWWAEFMKLTFSLMLMNQTCS